MALQITGMENIEWDGKTVRTKVRFESKRKPKGERIESALRAFYGLDVVQSLYDIGRNPLISIEQMGWEKGERFALVEIKKRRCSG